MWNKSILLFVILMIVSLVHTQGQSSTGIPQQDSEPTQQTISVQPIAIDPVVVNPAIPSNPNNQNAQQEPVVQDQGTGEIKIELQQKTQNNDTPQPQVPSASTNPNPDPREYQRQPNPNAQAEQRAVEEERQRIELDREMQRKQIRQKRERQQKERTEKYKAEQKRLQQLRDRQKAYQERRKKQMQGAQEVEYDAATKMSESERVRAGQVEALRQILTSQPDQISVKTMLFEINSQIEEYLIRPSVNMLMILRFTIYVENKNVYGFISDVTQTQPLKVYVYEDNARIVGQISCFYEAATKFEAKANSTYTIRAYNSGGPKLISFSYPNFLNAAITSKLLSEQQGIKHMQKARSSINGVLLSMSRLQEARVLDVKNANYLQQSMNRYYSYHIIQMGLFLIVCFIQIFFIKSLMKNQSIL